MQFEYKKLSLHGSEFVLVLSQMLIWGTERRIKYTCPKMKAG